MVSFRYKFIVVLHYYCTEGNIIRVVAGRSQRLEDEEIKSEIRHFKYKGEHYFAQGTVVVDDDTETPPHVQSIN